MQLFGIMASPTFFRFTKSLTEVENIGVNHNISSSA